jgi:hypothetical protein
MGLASLHGAGDGRVDVGVGQGGRAKAGEAQNGKGSRKGFHGKTPDSISFDDFDDTCE